MGAAFAPIAPKSAVSPQLNAAAVVAQPSFGCFDSAASNELFGNPIPSPQLSEMAKEALEPAIVFGMKVVDSIGSLKKRSKTCQVVRRRGRVYLIDKKNPRNKARQGGAKQKKRFVRK